MSVIMHPCSAGVGIAWFKKPMNYMLKLISISLSKGFGKAATPGGKFGQFILEAADDCGT